MEASISSMEGSRCALLAVAIVTSAAFVTHSWIPVRESGHESWRQRSRRIAIGESPISGDAGFQQFRHGCEPKTFFGKDPVGTKG
jgi:hypothetical protein